MRIYSFTGTGSRLALNLAEKLKQEGYVCTGYTVARFAEDRRLQRLNGGWKQEIGASWGEHALVFIGAAGIAIRAIAPFVKISLQILRLLFWMRRAHLPFRFCPDM